MDREKKVRDALLEHPEGLTIQELANTCELARGTVAKFIAKFEGEGILTMRRIGMAKLYRIANEA